MNKRLLTLIFACCICLTSFARQTDTLTTASGIKYFFTHKGNGPALVPGKLAIWHYTLTLTNGKKIDDSRERNEPLAVQFQSKKVIPGFDEALSLMHIGDRGIFIIPSALGYGSKEGTVIPPNSTLVFDIELLDTRDKSLEMALDSVLFEKPVTDTSKPRMVEVMKVFNDLKKAKFKDVYVSENDLNSIGYNLLKKYPADAITLFKLNVEMYPKSYNVYDSLAEGYMTMGNNKLAIKYYEKSLKLNPKNTNAEEMIKKMKAAGKE